jgi:TP901 family phage tail tape measure protein
VKRLAGKNIKGITIEIDGNASGLDKALKGVNTTSVTLNKELRDVNKLLKFDPGNATLLAQKQELLTKSIENTTTKLDSLKAAQSQVEQQFKAGQIGEEQYRAFQREITETEQSLKSYQNQMSAMQNEQKSLETNTKRLETLFEATGSSVDDFTDILGSRLVNAIKNGTASSDQLETAINKIGRSALGADGDLGKMKSALDQIDDGASIDKVKNDIEELKPAADDSSDSIDEMAESLGSGKMMGATSILSDVGDKIIEIGENAKDAALEFSSAYGSLNASTNLSGQELEKLKGVATEVFKSGVVDNIDEAVDATSLMKSAFSELNDQDLQHLTEQVLTLSQRTGTDVQENVRGASQLMNAFGLDSEAAFDLVASGYQNNLNYSGDFMDTLNEYAPLFAQAGYSADEMLSILQSGMENGSMNTDKTADAVKELQIRMGDGSLEGVIANFGQETQSTFEKWKNGQATVADVATSIQGDLQKMSPAEQQQALSLLSTQFEDLGIDAATSLFGVKNGFNDVSGAMDQASEKDPSQKWQSSLNTFMTSLQEIGAKILEALQPVLDFAGQIADSFNNLSEPVQNFILIFGGIIAIIAIVAPVIAAIVAIGATTLAIAAGIGLAIAAVIAVFMNWGTIVDWLKELWSGFSEWIGNLWQSIVEIASNVWETIKTTISDLIQACITVAQNLWSNAVSFISGIWNTILTTASNIWNGITTTISNAITNAKNTVSNIVSGISSTVSNVFNSIKNTASNIWNGITSAISNAINSAKNVVSSVVNGIKSTVTGVWNGIKSATSSVWNGIKSAIETPINAAKNAVNTAINAIKGFFNFKISWPHIPMPHFKASGSANPLDWLQGKNIPSIGIDWYAKGGILTKPTIFGRNGNSLMVGGEAGKEAVAPLSDLMAYVEAAVANQMQSNNAPIYVVLEGRVILNDKDVGELIAPTVKIENDRIEKMENKVYRNRR